LMVAMDTDHPGYGFAEHKGYSTAAHSAALRDLGPCSQHRQSFINVRRVAAAPRTGVHMMQAECQPDDSDRQVKSRWGKMGPGNQPRDGEGRLS